MENLKEINNINEYIEHLYKCNGKSLKKEEFTLKSSSILNNCKDNFWQKDALACCKEIVKMYQENIIDENDIPYILPISVFYEYFRLFILERKITKKKSSTRKLSELDNFIIALINKYFTENNIAIENEKDQL